MATPRAASFRALNTLSQQSRRSLHITGSNSSPSATSVMQKDRYTVYIFQSLPDLRSECKNRNLPARGSKNEVIERLRGHDMLQSRAFSIALKNVDRHRHSLGRKSPAETTPSRHFNTSRAMKAVGDTSTIDFAYLPMDYASFHVDTSSPIVPILPDNYSKTKNTDAVIPEPIMKPEIHTVAMDSTHEHTPSSMHEVTDNHSMEVDPYDLASTVRRSAGRALGGVQEEAGTVKEVWKGFLDDLLGKKGKFVR